MPSLQVMMCHLYLWFTLGSIQLLYLQGCVWIERAALRICWVSGWFLSLIYRLSNAILHHPSGILWPLCYNGHCTHLIRYAHEEFCAICFCRHDWIQNATYNFPYTTDIFTYVKWNMWRDPTVQSFLSFIFDLAG